MPASFCGSVLRAIAAAGILWPAAAAAQSLSLDDAITIAVRGNPDVRAAVAAAAAARAGQDAARSAWFPRVTLQEGWQRGDQPVYAFGSLLAQRRFTEADFAVASLNQPDPIDNYRAAVGVHQPIFDLAGTAARTTQATALAAVSQAELRITSADVAMAVARAYGRVISADAELRAAGAAVATATSGRSRAAARREAGTVTQADLLAFDVHLAQMDARRVRAESDARVARATVNRLLGRPLDTPFDPIDAEPGTAPPVAASARPDQAARPRPEIDAAVSRAAAADAGVRVARAARLPLLSFDGGWEWNGRTWTDRAAAWVVGIRAEWSFATGGGESAGVRAADAARQRALAQQASAESAARLALLAATDDVTAAQARRRIGVAAVAQAREGERIVRDRYDAGLATTTEVLAAAQALLDAESLAGSARADLAVALVALRQAEGTLP
jgi:outer membrane protein TolC